MSVRLFRVVFGMIAGVFIGNAGWQHYPAVTLGFCLLAMFVMLVALLLELDE